MNRSQALHDIEHSSGNGQLEEATYRYALIIVDLINDAAAEELLHCQTSDDVSAWIRRDALDWQAKLSDEAFAEWFEIGHSKAYGCIEQMLSCIDYEFVFELLLSMRQLD